MNRASAWQSTWRRGERAIRWHLRIRGWRLLGQNVRIGHDELDLVVVHPHRSVLAVVEVKATRGQWPIMSRVTEAKQYRLARAASRLPVRWRRDRLMRFDVGLVRVGRWRCNVEYCPAAFEAPCV
ncbi:MAG: YraN family protein [Phycisphaerae bacterium]|nr:YraN family protein [Phycisphaerae bacterium]MBT5583336.1 YraN family protein [Phycisphaerae bacterium]